MIAILAASIIAGGAPAECAPVELALADKRMPARFNAKLVARTTKNFDVAYAQACKEDYLQKPLIDAGAKDKRLFLKNAPEANVASIYLDSGRMVLEYPFVSAGGKTEVPSLAILLEAIYCAAHGASAKEQEESGRCLPD